MISKLDDFCVSCVKAFVMFFVDWFNVSYRTVELVLTILYPTLYIAVNHVEYHMLRTLSAGEHLFFSANALFCALLIQNSTKTNSSETREIVGALPIATFIRLTLATLLTADVVTSYTIFFSRGPLWYHILSSCSRLGMTILFISLMIRYDDERGKKVKSLLAKLKLVFHIGWSTAPQGA